MIAAVLLAAQAVSACGDEQSSAPAKGLSRAEAISRIDAICRQTEAQFERAGAEPSISSGSRLEVERYARWQERVNAVLEAGLRRIERVPIPRDGREREIRAYANLSRETIRAGRRFMQAVRAGDTSTTTGRDPELLLMELESSADQAGFVAKRYGLHACGA